MANIKTGVTRKQITLNFPKNELFLPPDTHMHACVSGGGWGAGLRSVCFLENLTCFTRFEIRPFALLPMCIQKTCISLAQLD